MIITRTPFRISFFGGGSDYPSYYSHFGGATLGTTIDKYCWIIVRKSPPLGIPYKIVYSKVEEKTSIAEIEHRAVREVLLDLGYPDPLEIYYTGDLPARSGIGSSSAFVVGLIKAITTLDQTYWDEDPDCGKGYWNWEQLAKEAIHVERNLLHETVGDQDQFLCAKGGLNIIYFSMDGRHQVVPVFRNPEDYFKCVDILERHLMLFYTGMDRISSEVAASYVDQLPDKRNELRDLVDLVQEGKEVLQALIHGGNPDEFGNLLHKAWNIKRDLSGEISTPEIEEFYRKALEAGAGGGKLLGAGKGGFFLLYVKPEYRFQVRQALAYPEIPFKLENSGCCMMGLPE